MCSKIINIIYTDKVKNKNNESDPINNEITSPFYKRDDLVDIHANTLSILNDLTSYTQRGVAGFEINGDINCSAFSDQFNNGLAGWVATFELTTHNDKNRCLFFLINPSGSGYIIEDCVGGDRYKAVLDESGSIGQVFSSKYTLNSNGGSEAYDNLKCYTIVEQINNVDDWDYVNMKVLALPFANYGNCSVCELWISPKIWSTTPAKWGSGVEVETHQWINV